MSLYEPMDQEPEPSREEPPDCDGFADGLPDVYSVPGRGGTAEQVRAGMREAELWERNGWTH